MKDQNEVLRIQETARAFYKEYIIRPEDEEAIFKELYDLSDENRHKELDDRIQEEIREKEEQKKREKQELDSKQRSAIKRKYEKKKHEKFVEECLAPDGYLRDRGQVFALMLPPEESDTEILNDSRYEKYHISLVTPAMVHTDLRYFEEFDDKTENKPWWYKEYRPYYYDLSIYVDKNKDEDYKEWLEFYHKHSEGNWFRAILVPTGSEGPTGLRKTGLLRFGGSKSWTEKVDIILINDGSKGKGIDKLLLELRALYNNKINSVTSFDPYSYLSRVFSQKREYNVRVLNEGEANCIHIFANNGTSFMFDVGIPFEKYNDPYDSENSVDNADYTVKDGEKTNDGIGILATYKPDFILISHWHFDHVAGFIHLCNDGLNCKWIVPELDNKIKKVEYVRLSLYLAKQKKLGIISGGYDSRLFASPSGDIELFRGQGDTFKSGEPDLNAGSILLSIKDVLFAADCMYRYWPKDLTRIISNISVLVVPHHGAAVNDDDRKVIAKFKGRKRQAVVCVGNNGYYHPTDSHFNALIDNDLDSIFVTGGAKKIEYMGMQANMFTYFKSINSNVKIHIK